MRVRFQVAFKAFNQSEDFGIYCHDLDHTPPELRPERGFSSLTYKYWRKELLGHNHQIERKNDYVISGNS